jgi:transcriptional antiterminator/mannitol/fructose-specific phosphotransferase system IIA component (Ntr-type)
MVGYRLKRVRYWLDERNVELVTKPNYGIIINATNHTRKKLKRELECSGSGEVIWSAKERWKILVFHLLTKEAPTIVKRLQADIGVSRPTLLNDMDKAEKWLEDYNLVLVRRSGYGIRIKGEEHALREATVCLILDNLNESHLQSYLDYSKSPPESALEPRFESCVDTARYLEDLNLRSVTRHIRSLEYRLDVHFTDITNKYLSLLIAITIRRSRKGHFINHFPVDIKKIKNTIGYIEAKRLCSLIENEFGLIFPENEIYYMAINLIGAKITDPQTALSDLPLNPIAIWDPLDIIGDFLSQVSLYLHPIIRVDQRLKRNLSFHIKPVLIRLRYGLPIRNPLLEQIKLKYPYLFKVARECSCVIEERIGRRIPDDEVGYIVMHLAVALERLVFRDKSPNRVLLVCGAGMATVWLMVSKLKCLFPDINIKDVLSASEIPHKASYFGYVDLVISTVPLGDLGVPTVTVSPLLEDNELLKIRAMLRSSFRYCSSPIAYGSKGPSLVDLISADNIRVNIHVECWPEVVEEAAKPLLMSGAIEREYVLAMMEIIRIYGPYVVIAPRIALLHARPEQGVNRVCMSLITLEKPINFGHPRFDPVEVAFVLGATDDFKHINALHQLTSLLRDERKIESICEARSKIEALQILHEHVTCLDYALQT